MDQNQTPAPRSGRWSPKWLDDLPTWALRGTFLVVGLIDAVAIAAFIMAFALDFEPAVDIAIENRSTSGATVQLDVDEAVFVDGGQDAAVTDEQRGRHRLILRPDSEGTMVIEIAFDADRWGSGNFSVEVHDGVH